MNKRILFLSMAMVTSFPIACMYPLCLAIAAGTVMYTTYDKQKVAREIGEAKAKVAAARERLSLAEKRADALPEGSLELDAANADVDTVSAELDDLLQQMEVALDKAAAQERERERYAQEPYWFEKKLQEILKEEADREQRFRDIAEERDMFCNINGLALDVVRERKELFLAVEDLRSPAHIEMYLADSLALKNKAEALKLAWHPDKNSGAKRARCNDYYRIVSRHLDECLAEVQLRKLEIDKRLKEQQDAEQANIFGVWGKRTVRPASRRNSMSMEYVLVVDNDEDEQKCGPIEAAAVAEDMLRARNTMPKAEHDADDFDALMSEDEIEAENSVHAMDVLNKLGVARADNSVHANSTLSAIDAMD